MVVNSIITNLVEGQKVRAGAALEVKGMAWDAGYVIQSVEVSTDGGAVWNSAVLGEDAGRYSFRPWSFAFTPPKVGEHAVIVRAANKIGQSQPTQLILNPGGYNHNTLHRVTVNAA